MNRFQLSVSMLLCNICMLLHCSACLCAEPVAKPGLRVDILLSGEAGHTEVKVAAMYGYNCWSGPERAVAKPAVGDFVYSLFEGDSLICTDGFSSIYSEWLVLDFPGRSAQVFEHTLTMPLPKAAARLLIDMLNPDGTFTTVLEANINPDDLTEPKLPRPRVKELVKGGDVESSLDVLFIAEGYTDTTVASFDSIAAKLAADFLKFEPFDKHKQRISVRTVYKPSEDEGPSVPSYGVVKNTAVGSTFDVFGSTRYLFSFNVFDMWNYIADVPCDMVVVLVNTPIYGGGGVYNSMSVVSAGNPYVYEMLMHELGHSFAGLADEYHYSTDPQCPTCRFDVEPWAANITTMVDFGSKWKDLYDAGKAGLVEGAAFAAKGVYRSSRKCLMRELRFPFCMVCERRVTSRIEYYLSL